MHRLLLLLLLIPVTVLAGGQVVLSPVNVVSLKDGSVATDQAIIIKSDRITAIMPAAQADGEAEQVDGHGGWVIPGLAEMHAHVPSQQRGEQYVKDVLTLFLANGVTTIRGMLGQPWHLALRELLATGAWEGPRLITSGPSFNGNTVSSPEQAARRVRDQAAAGYDFLKLHPGLETDEFVAIATTARELNMPFAGHVSFGVGLDQALFYRQDSIDHLDGYAQEMLPEDSALRGQPPSWFGLNLAAEMDPSRAPQLASATARAGVWNVPTQTLFETTSGELAIDALLARPGMDMLSDSLRDSWVNTTRQIRGNSTPEQRARFIKARRALIAALQSAGAGLLLGSDAPQIMNVPGNSTHQELAAYVEAGLTPLQALRTGTANVATYFGDRDRGAVRVGHVADLVLLEANPLEDIDNSTTIIGVMRAGRWYDRAALDAMLEGIRSRGI